ncbi:MAG: SUMF1/EgtB/PvdO family nonheme iron enzyme [Patescibacteria group bacterium]
MASVLDAGRALVPDAQAARPSRPGMVYIPGGAYRTGSTQAEVDERCRTARENVAALCALNPTPGPGCLRSGAEDICQIAQRELPARTVVLAPFFIDQTEVTTTAFVTWLNSLSQDDLDINHTRVLWLRSMQDEPIVAMAGSRRFARGSNQRTVPREYAGIDRQRGRFLVLPGFENMPVTHVYWSGANAYCQAQGKRLLRSDEWEAAARGSEGRRFPTGDQPPTCAMAHMLATYTFERCPGEGGPRPVESFAQDRSPFGVLNMAGNVGEWVAEPCIRPSELLPPDQGGGVPNLREMPSFHRMYGGDRNLEAVAAASWSCALGVGSGSGFRCAADVPTGHPDR